VLAAGAYIDPSGAPASDEAGEADDHDEGGDDDHPEYAADSSEDAAQGSEAQGGDESRPRSERDDREGMGERPLPPAGEPPALERPAFSLFSWMRRDPAPRPSSEDDEPVPGPRKPDPLE
jgi:hypothetical protein